MKREFRPFGYKEELYRQPGVVVEARISRKSAVGVHGNHWIIGAYRTDSNGDIVTKIEGDKKVEDQLTIEEIQQIDSKLIEILDIIVGRFHRSIPRSRRVENGTGLASRAYFHAHIIEIVSSDAELASVGLTWHRVIDNNYFLVKVEAKEGEGGPATTKTA